MTMNDDRLAVDASTPVEECVARTEAWVEEHVPVAWREAAARGGNSAIREVRSRADYEAWYPVFGASGLVMPTWAPRVRGPRGDSRDRERDAGGARRRTTCAR